MHIGLISTDLSATEAWARMQGLSPVESNGILVRVEGDPDTIAKALGITWETSTASEWHTEDTPILPAHIEYVSGLSNRGILKHYHVGLEEATTHKTVVMDGVPPIITTGKYGPGYTPGEICAAYGIDQPWDGSGETIAVAEWSNDFSQKDLDTFIQAFNLPSCTPRVVNVGNYQPGSAIGVEANLDVQWAHAIASGANLTVYNAKGGSSYSSFGLEVTALLNAVLTDKTPPSILSISYGNGESSFVPQDLFSWDRLMTDLGNKGITVLVASGDQGAYGMHLTGWPQTQNVGAPASCIHALAVGGTSLFMEYNTKEDEWAWSNAVNFGASGGGYSKVFGDPPYQPGQTHRSVPDLAAVADPMTPCTFTYNGHWYIVGGTSVATPIVAGLLTRVNHARRLAGFHPLGYITPVLYDLQRQGKALCNDMVKGNNTCFSVTGYDAKKGYDEVTGWGSPIAQAWFDEFAYRAPKP